jgi:hypothetical protein
MRPDQVKIIARQLGVTQTDVIDMNRRLGGDVSLNAPIREDGNSGEWEDRLVDEQADQETTLAASEEFENRRKALASALAVLNDRERRIFEARRLAEEPITLNELADEFGVSRERVRQISVCVREGAEVGEEPRRCDGNSGASAGALASNPLPWWEKLPMDVSPWERLRQPDEAKGVPLDDQRTEI